MAKKYYGVKVGKTPGVYETWSETQENTNGFSGAEFKSFALESDAKEYVEGVVINSIKSDNELSNSKIDDNINKLLENECIAFVDGTYDLTTNTVGYGSIIFSNGGIINRFYKKFPPNLYSKEVKLRNVFGELEGAKEAVNFALGNNKEKVTIYYDYKGIEKWATHEWTSKKDIPKRYISFMDNKKKLIDIEFIKISAHSGNKYNEEADKLAKKSIEKDGYKTYDDGSVYFSGITKNNWKEIINELNEETDNLKKSLNDDNDLYENIEFINGESNPTNKMIKYIIKQKNHKVYINSYSDTKCFVQGKNSILMDKVISKSIEILRSGNEVLEVLNSRNALEVENNIMDNNFLFWLPHFSAEKNSKIYNNLYVAVYNLHLDIELPDYTSLLTPIFRAYDFCLHKILHGFCGLKTASRSGSNQFGFFSLSKETNKYICNYSVSTKLSSVQKEYVELFYNNYHNIRHPYTHWSLDDFDTAVCTDLSETKKMIKDGLELIDKSFDLF